MEPTFTIVMPAYNTAAWIGDAIRSVLAQTRDDFELLVVDDGSTDGTAPAVGRFTDDPRVRLLRAEHRGAASARNLGVAEARGRYLSLLDSDDLWMPPYLETMGAALDADADAGFAYTDAWVLDDATGRVQRVTAMHYQHPPEPPPRDAATFLSLLIQRNFVYASATVRRSVLERVGPFDTRFQAAHDYELWLRLLAQGHRAIRPSGLLAVYRHRPGSLTTDQLGAIVNLRAVLERVATHYDVPQSIRTLARERVRELNGRLTPDRQALRLSFRTRLRLIALYRALRKGSRLHGIRRIRRHVSA